MRHQNQCRNPTPKTTPKHPRCCRNSAPFSRPKMVSKTTTELVSVEPSTWLMLYQGGVAKIASVHMDHVGACAMGGGGSMARWYVALAMPNSACPPTARPPPDAAWRYTHSNAAVSARPSCAQHLMRSCPTGSAIPSTRSLGDACRAHFGGGSRMQDCGGARCIKPLSQANAVVAPTRTHSRRGGPHRFFIRFWLSFFPPKTNRTFTKQELVHRTSMRRPITASHVSHLTRARFQMCVLAVCGRGWAFVRPAARGGFPIHYERFLQVPC